MKHRRNAAPCKISPQSRPSEPADENRDINENLASPLVGLAALRESLPGLEKKASVNSKIFQPRSQRAPAFTGLTPTTPPTSAYSNVFHSVYADEECGDDDNKEGQKNGDSGSGIKNGSGGESKEGDPLLTEALKEAVRRISGEDKERVGEDARPRVVMDVGSSAKDMLLLSNIPDEMTYDRLHDLVSPFGEVLFINWDAASPDVAEIVYASARDADEAAHYLSDSILGGSEDESPLGAELKSRDGGTQLFVGDLSPSITEEMLEEAFGRLVSNPVSATLKRDPGNNSTIGYGFLTFEDEFDASAALLLGHRMEVGDVKVRVGRAERNTFLYVSDLQPNVSLEELKSVFGQYGSLVEEDTVIVRRSYAFIRYRNRASAENSKRTLDKTSLRGKITVRYAEAEPQKSTVQVQFHSQLKKPPASLKELLHSTFSKYGHCVIDIPRHSGDSSWRRVAYVHYHGDVLAAALAATNAVQNVTFVSSLPVLASFSRSLVPRVSPKNAAGGQYHLGKGPRTNGKSFGGQGGNRRDKNANREHGRSPVNNARGNDGAVYPSYFAPMYPGNSAWRGVSQNSEAEAAAAENRGMGGDGGISPSRKSRRGGNGGGNGGSNGEAFPTTGHNFLGAQRRMNTPVGGPNVGVARGNEQQFAYVWVPAMGHYSGQEMTPEFQSAMAPPGFVSQQFGQQHPAPGMYGGQLGSSPGGGGQYGMHLPVLPQSSLGMGDMAVGNFRVDGQPENLQH